MSSRNISWGRGGGKGDRCIGLTTLPPSCADRLEIWEPQLPGTLRSCPALYVNYFIFTCCRAVKEVLCLGMVDIRPASECSGTYKYLHILIHEYHLKYNCMYGKDEVTGNGENYIMRSLVICTPYPILCGW
jgi:hypothetical protein